MAGDPICVRCASQERGSLPLPKDCLCGDHPAPAKIPADVLDAARRAIAERVGPEARSQYLAGKLDHLSVIQACASVIVAERKRAAHVAHGWMHDNGLGANAADVALEIMK
ncbi:hypothetical protein SAMN05428953_12681 [Mesorhizobium muleiense]|uniref:Uncharacterized protein n=1 Tax=Mesorhizobium muleiense TaxID=1004279 RepID=A0A1G9H653_9HYPH|nr:hypothetical protein [Mesorhizobium muleiense]SDL08430.1 hypothetical protein SAMN05428953_12681 [Mesorhizobium muleiense]